LKFTIITRYYHPTPDGIAHHSSYLNQYLIELGHSVQVIYDDGIISLTSNEIGILVNKIKRHQSDWIIFQYNGYSYNRFGAPKWLSRLFKKITTYTQTQLCLIVHETYIRNEASLKLKVYQYLQKKALKSSCKYAKCILTTTQYYQNQISNLGFKSDVLFTPSNFENYIAEIVLPPNYAKIEKFLNIGTFGNRDPKFLLEVIANLEQLGLHCNFNFIGNYQPKYIKAIKDLTKKLKTIKISRSGKLTDKNIVLQLSKLDAFILLEPVREDHGGGLNTKSGASATALCMSLPIFSTKGDFTSPDVFIEGENYICLNHKSVSETTNAIFKNLNQLNNLLKIGNNGYNLYQNQFSWQQYVSRMLKLMEN
jgi:glycosyltransferase involved in cell wall biosynthesis